MEEADLIPARPPAVHGLLGRCGVPPSIPGKGAPLSSCPLGSLKGRTHFQLPLLESQEESPMLSVMTPQVF